MTNPIELLEQKLEEIKQIKQMCIDAKNTADLKEVKKQEQMYIVSINAINNALKL